MTEIFNGESSVARWEAINLVDRDDGGLLYKYGCMSQAVIIGGLRSSIGEDGTDAN